MWRGLPTHVASIQGDRCKVNWKRVYIPIKSGGLRVRDYEKKAILWESTWQLIQLPLEINCPKFLQTLRRKKRTIADASGGENIFSTTEFV